MMTLNSSPTFLILLITDTLIFCTLQAFQCFLFRYYCISFFHWKLLNYRIVNLNLKIFYRRYYQFNSIGKIFCIIKFAHVDKSILLFKNEVYPQSLEKYVLCGLVILYMGNWSCKVQTFSYYLSFTNLFFSGSDLFLDPDR